MFKDEAKAILDSRQATYGDRVTNMEAAASMVEAYLLGVDQRADTALTGADFAMIMALYKIYRFAVTPDYQDNIDDIEGYLKIVRECMQHRLIPAKTAEEYQRIKKERAMNAHPSGRAEKDAEEAAMRAWEKRVYGFVDELPGISMDPEISELIQSKVTDERNTWKEQRDEGAVTGEQLAKNLLEEIRREREMAETETESQRIMEERRIWKSRG